MIQIVDPTSLAWAILRLYVTTLICLVPLSVCLLYSLLRLLQCGDASEASVLCSLAGCAFYGIVLSSLLKEGVQGTSTQNNSSNKPKGPPIVLKVYALSKSLEDTSTDDKDPFLSDGARDMSSPCPICLEGYEAGNRVSYGEQCEHAFHAACIGQWTELLKTDCPCCRQGLLKKNDLLTSSLVESVTMS